MENSKNKKDEEVLRLQMSIGRKKEILAEINERKRHPREIFLENGVEPHDWKRRIEKWTRQIERIENPSFKIRVQISEDTKRDIIRQIQMGAITREDALKKLHLSDIRQIDRWIIRYSSDITPVSNFTIMCNAESNELLTEENIQKQKDYEKDIE